MRSPGCNIFSVITSRLERSAALRRRSPGEMMLLTFIAVAHPSLTHLFALCFIELDESVFPLLLSSMADSVTTATYPADSARSTVDEVVDVT